MNPIEPTMLDQYTQSGWALWSSVFILIGVVLYTYDRYAKRWSASTGTYQTNATVVFSELCVDGHSRTQAIVIYQYEVSGRIYRGELSAPKVNLAHFVEQYPLSTEFPVFYSAREHAFSSAFTPPNNITLIKRTVANCFAFPFVSLNVASLAVFAALS